MCQVQHFISSGIPAAGFIAAIRPHLEASLHTVAALVVDAGPVQQPVKLGFDICKVDPEICVIVHAPHLILSNLDDYLHRVQMAVTQFADRNIASNARASGAGAG
jgi:hypothetical protein